MATRLIYILIFIFLIGCNSNDNSNNLNAKKEILYPKIYLDSISKTNNLELYYIDSTLYFNHVLAGQLGQFTINQLELDKDINYDTVFLTFITPLREEKVAVISLLGSNFEFSQSKFDDTIFSHFIEELMDLNWETQTYFHQSTTNLLDKINTYFSKVVYDKYKDELDEYAYFFGYDCYDMFYHYFIDCRHEIRTEATEFVNMLREDSLLISNEIKSELFKIIDKHCSNKK